MDRNNVFYKKTINDNQISIQKLEDKLSIEEKVIARNQIQINTLNNDIGEENLLEKAFQETIHHTEQSTRERASLQGYTVEWLKKACGHNFDVKTYWGALQESTQKELIMKTLDKKIISGQFPSKG